MSYWLYLQNVFRIQSLLTTSTAIARPKPPSSLTWMTHLSHLSPSYNAAWLQSVLHRAAGGTHLNRNQVRSVSWFKTFQRLLLHCGPHCNCRCCMTQAPPSPPASSSLSPALGQEAVDTLYASYSSLGGLCAYHSFSSDSASVFICLPIIIQISFHASPPQRGLL